MNKAVKNKVKKSFDELPVKLQSKLERSDYFQDNLNRSKRFIERVYHLHIKNIREQHVEFRDKEISIPTFDNHIREENKILFLILSLGTLIINS